MPSSSPACVSDGGYWKGGAHDLIHCSPQGHYYPLLICPWSVSTDFILSSKASRPSKANEKNSKFQRWFFPGSSNPVLMSVFFFHWADLSYSLYNLCLVHIAYSHLATHMEYICIYILIHIYPNDVCLYHSPLYYFSQGASVYLELTDSAKLADQGAL